MHLEQILLFYSVYICFCSILRDLVELNQPQVYSALVSSATLLDYPWLVNTLIFPPFLFFAAGASSYPTRRFSGATTPWWPRTSSTWPRS